MATEEAKPKKAAPKKRTTLSHPTYQEMINNAIVALKERNGSSQYAISRFIEEKQKQLPPTFRKKLLFSLKNLVKSGKIVKVKNSFKLPSSAKPEKKPVAAKPKAPAKAKPVPVKAAAAAKPKPKLKPKAVAAAVAKPKARPKPKERPAKVARTSARTSPGKKPAKTAAAPKPKKAVAVKKSPAKTVKSKSVKTPTKKVLPRKAKK